MTRRLNDINTYKVNGKKGTYMVSLVKVTTDCNGNLRYRAIITKIVGDDLYSSPVYTFTGHHYREIDECKYIVSVYEKVL